jgi:hypothetical protein
MYTIPFCTTRTDTIFLKKTSTSIGKVYIRLVVDATGYKWLQLGLFEIPYQYFIFQLELSERKLIGSDIRR